MGFRLLILNWWRPKYLIRRELANLSNQTTAALQSLVTQYAASKVGTAKEQQYSGSIGEQRASMAQTHVQLVDTLESTLGHDKAVQLGREALFAVGQNLGKQTRSKLGVGDKPEDLIKASKILYRILGIEFHLEWLDDSNAVAIVDRCALAEKYSALTCEVLSATDEGVIKGLQPNVTMKFEEYMTSGCKNCRARIQFTKKEN